MDTVKPKRFSFSGFGSSLSRSLSFSSTKSKDEDPGLPSPPSEDELRKNKRTQKTKSLYIKSFRRSTGDTPKTTFDPSEANQPNSKEVKNAIRRSLSAVLYATPHASSENTNKLVPILVTSDLSDSVGGIMISEPGKSQDEEVINKKEKKKAVEYDNTLEIFSNKQNDAVTILWQGYGYTVQYDREALEVASEILQEEENVTDTPHYLESRFEKEVWTSYRGLIHPLHLFEAKEEVVDRGRWAGLGVSELRRYYDNYGSMMLKIRETRMIQQQRQYHCLTDVNKEWIIMSPTEAERKVDDMS
ncbi:hypothetical protein EDC96DRAFT_122750 [Choanephora cucurbitarum]|nr:hypothetical protein EDC96DRAFT_122750 [Choanephora cucurbitarum]